MTARRIVFAAVALAVAVMLAPASAQDDKKSKKEQATQRSVQGVVFDNKDVPVVGAVVQLKDLRSLQMRSYITKEDGEYHFSSLKMDQDYEVEAKNNNLTSGPRKISIFDNRKIVIQNLKADKPEKK